MKTVIILIAIWISACQAAYSQSNKVPLISQGVIIGQAVPLRGKTVLFSNSDLRTLKKEVYIPNPRLARLTLGEITIEQLNTASDFAHSGIYSRHDSLFLEISFTPQSKGEVCTDTLKIWSINLKRPVIRLYLAGEKGSLTTRLVDPNSSFSLYNNEEIVKSSYRLYPNPVSTVLYIEPSALQKTENQIQMNITNLTGRVLYQGDFRSSLSVDNWPMGTYILSVQSEGILQRLKFLKE